MTNRIRELREAAGLTQADLAARVDVARQTIIAIEKGRYDLSLSLAFRIADAFGQTVEAVFRPHTGVRRQIV
ncbi:MAG TPA: transcriptional regulator, partial [Parvularcula sp.]|nr:transcriptional regulator [Parvularcula sp.]